MKAVGYGDKFFSGLFKFLGQENKQKMLTYLTYYNFKE